MSKKKVMKKQFNKDLIMNEEEESNSNQGTVARYVKNSLMTRKLEIIVTWVGNFELQLIGVVT